ncbi:MAG: P-type conjugative transfer protein TrbL, partial [Cellulomonas sp.]
LGLMLLLVSGGALAAGNDFAVTNANPWDVLNLYQGLEGSFASKALPIAESVFGALAAIEFAWTWVMWILEKGGGDGESVIPTLLKKIMTIGFMYFLLLNAFSGLDLVPNLIGGFEYIGAQLTGVGANSINSTTANSAYNMLTPGGIFNTAGQLIAIFSKGVNNAIQQLSWYQFGDAFVYGLAEMLFIAIILLVFAMLAIALSLALIESYIILGAGVVFLAFGASRWTMPFAEKYISYAVGVGVKLFAFYLVLGIGGQLAHAWGNDLTTMAGQANGEGLVSLVFLAGMAFSLLLYGYVAMKVPSIASAFITGAGGFMSGGDLTSTVASAAAMGAAAALTGGAALGAAGAMGASGMGMATKGAGALASAAGQGAQVMSGLASQATGAMGDMATSAMNGMADGINSLGGSGGGGPSGSGLTGGGSPAGGASEPAAGDGNVASPSSDASSVDSGPVKGMQATGQSQVNAGREGGGVAQAVASPDAGSMPSAEQTAVGDGNVASPSSDASSVDSGPVQGMQATGQSQVNAGTEGGSSPGESAQNAQEVRGQDRQNTRDTGKGGEPNANGFMNRGAGEHLANAVKHGQNAAEQHGNMDPAQGHGAINIRLEV